MLDVHRSESVPASKPGRPQRCDCRWDRRSGFQDPAKVPPACGCRSERLRQRAAGGPLGRPPPIDCAASSRAGCVGSAPWSRSTRTTSLGPKVAAGRRAASWRRRSRCSAAGRRGHRRSARAPCAAV